MYADREMSKLLRLILFWGIRILALSFSIVNLTYLKISGLGSIIFVLLGIVSCAILYGWGVFTREVGRKIPGLFILFRVLQVLMILAFKAMPLHYFLTYVSLDLVFFLVLMYDSKFKFILREPRDASKIKVRRE